jgi:hypothetical protein
MVSTDRTRGTWLPLSVLCTIVLSCAGPPAAPPAAPAATPSPIEKLGYVRTQEWTFKELSRPVSVPEQELVNAYQRLLTSMRPTDEYMCVAREMAAHLAERNALPDETLQRWIAGRCHAPNVFYWTSSIVLYSDGTVLDGPLSKDRLESVTKGLPVPTTKQTVFGVGAHPAGPNAFVVLVTSNPEASLSTKGPDAEGTVQIDGTFDGTFTWPRAIINRGVSGTAACNIDGRVRLPNFRFACKMDPEDREAWIDIVAGRPLDSMEATIAQVLARRPDAKPAYRAPHVHLPKSPDDTQALLAGINTFRRAEKLQGVRLAMDQTRLAQRMIPSLYRVAVNIDDFTDEKLRRELVVGKEVPGIIREARITVRIAYGGSAADWLAANLDQPVAREVMIDPDAELVAIATYRDPLGFGATLVTYSLFHELQHAPMAKQTIAKLRSLRAKDARATTFIEAPPELEHFASEVMAGQIEPNAALQAALRVVNARSPRRFAGTVMEESAEKFHEFPADLLAPDSLDCAVVVTHAKRPGDTWGEWVIFILYAPGHAP